MGNVTWQINDDDMVYATVAKGYRIGGANPLFPVSACSEITVEPESYDSDIGVELRARFQGQVLRRTAAGVGQRLLSEMEQHPADL